MANKSPDILQLMGDPRVFLPWFKDAETWTTWRTWRTFLAALFGLPMDAATAQLYQRHTGREAPPVEPFSEAALVVGRRGGKSFITALIAVYLACFRDYRPHLVPGEVATVAVLAADRKQARVIMRYIAGLLEGVPMLAQLITRQTTEEIELSNRVTIEVQTASFRATRGYTYAAVLADEIAFWRSDESANPDAEILAAIRPGLASIPGAMLLLLSSPYARRGELWNTYKDNYGKDAAPVLVWQADTRSMNPTIPQRVIDQAYARDPARAAAEYGGQFRTDVESFISREAVEVCVRAGSYELPPVSGTHYTAFVDPSGGSRDSMTMAVAHHEAEMVVLDAVREVKPPFSPESVVADFGRLLKSYGIRAVTGDRYAGEWPREQFRKQGIEYRTSDRDRSRIYGDLLPLINSGSVTLLDNQPLITQLTTLERRTGRGGKDSIDHAPGAHDDLINAAAGALVNVRTAEHHGPRIRSL